MRFRLSPQKADYALLLTVLALACFGILMIASASLPVAMEKFGDKKNYTFVWQQLGSLGLGFLGLMIASQIDYRVWRRGAIWFLIITILLLLAVYLPGLGQAYKGAARWLNLGVVSFQPSEVIKLTFILYLAAWLEGREEKMRSFSESFLPFIVLLAIIAALLIKQPDLGTLTIIALSAVAIFFVAGAAYRHLGLGLLVTTVVFWIFIRTSPYRWQRFLTFLNPKAEILGAGYHINQAILAVGSGGLLGRGFGKSVQKFLYLPEPYTDSIFAVICEELGFLRATLIPLAFLFIAWRGFIIARHAPDKFSQLVAVGITSWIVLQAFVNMSAITGLIPLTGVPLPLVSFGGSSLVVTLTAVGILLNISRQVSVKEEG